jgi:H+/Cl- antiporter ClcA
LNNNKYKDVFVILFGCLLAFMIQYCGLFISGTSEHVINEGFKNASIMDNTINSQTFNYKNVIGKIVNCIISLGSGLSGGIIIPSMTIGSGLGNILYKMLITIFSENVTTIPIENFMYIGMVAFLSPMLDAPTTSAIVINRISNQSFNTIPISLIASFISYFIYKKLHNHK